MSVGVSYVYETVLVDRETELGLSVSTIPLISLPHFEDRDDGVAVDVANVLDLDLVDEISGRTNLIAAVAAILDEAGPQALSEYLGAAPLELSHDGVGESPWQSAVRLVDLEVIPVVMSPLTAASLTSLMGGGGLVTTTVYIAATAGVGPALRVLMVGAFGIVIVAGATGLGDGLRARLRRWAAGEPPPTPLRRLAEGIPLADRGWPPAPGPGEGTWPKRRGAPFQQRDRPDYDDL